MANVIIRNLYSPGLSTVTLSFYKTNLSIVFSPWVQEQGRQNKLNTKHFISTTISDENAAALYMLSKQISEGTQSDPVQYLIQCNKQTMLTFEYDTEKACLIIEKGAEKIFFEFPTHEYRIKEKGQIVTKVLQSGLIVFSETLGAYLSTVVADRHMDKHDKLYPTETQPQESAMKWR